MVLFHYTIYIYSIGLNFVNRRVNAKRKKIRWRSCCLKLLAPMSSCVYSTGNLLFSPIIMFGLDPLTLDHLYVGECGGPNDASPLTHKLNKAHVVLL